MFEVLTGTTVPGTIDPIRIAVPKTTVTHGASPVSVMPLIRIPLNQCVLIKMKIWAKAGNAFGVYEITGAFKNIAGTITQVGTQSTIQLEDTTAWLAALVVNSPNGTADLQITPDTTTDTIIQGQVEFWTY